MVLWGHMDDSGDGTDILTLSCLIAHSPTWVFLGLEWEKLIEQKNSELIAARRKPFSRFHASDCSCRKNEFSDWDTAHDQIPFMQALLSIMEKYKFDVASYTINLKELVKHLPIAKPNPRAFAHVLLLHYIMDAIAAGSLKNHKDAVIGIIHDRGSYDSVLLDAFNVLVKNESYFPAAKRFCSITPMGWEHCVALQQADLLAYENYKESSRDAAKRGRRKSLEWILNRGQLGGFLKGFNSDALSDVRTWFDNLDARVRDAFLQAARIPTKPQRKKKHEKQPRV